MSARILIVDDLLPNVKLLEAALNSEYYDVVTAKSGKEALNILENTAVDIVLLDVMMPEMDGFEVCKRIKANPKTSALPVIMVTALSETQDKVHGLQVGADDFLTKPIDNTALFARIKSLLRLKFLTDELKLRNQTHVELGDETPAIDINRNYTKNSKIVIADDDKLQAQKIGNILAQQGANISLIFNMHDFLNKIKEVMPDLVIVSTQIFSIDGLRLCSQIRSDEATRNMSILILVDEDEKHILLKGLDMGINDYIILPYDQNEVIARVNTQVRRKYYQDQLKEYYSRSVEMAFTDELTQLYNRRYFDVYFPKMLYNSLETNKKIALLVIDIDHFKHINDTYGHQSGDAVLQQLAALISKNDRTTDLVVRYGGEEFVILLPNVTLEDAQMVAERIRKITEETEFNIPVEPSKIHITISIGLSLSQKNDSIIELFSRADKALYSSKENGRNKITVA